MQAWQSVASTNVVKIVPGHPRTMATQTENVQDAELFMLSHITWTILLLYITCGCTQTQNSLATLTSATQIETATVGESAQISKYYVAFTNIMGSKTAKADLKRVFNDSVGLPGKLYALYGLSSVDGAEFQNLSRTLDQSSIVQVMNYCVKENSTVKEILNEISTGRMQQKLRPWQQPSPAQP